MTAVDAAATATRKLPLPALMVAVAGALTALDTLGGTGTFLVFAGLCGVAFLYLFKFASETKGRQLDEIRHYWENGGKWPTEAIAKES